ncbi:MAG: superoxide dismutase family protein [Rhodocyclaceae bacterium]|nr:MAG: superoxide dismutase family protein [Rhodocyclaceae bacterium]
MKQSILNLRRNISMVALCIGAAGCTSIGGYSGPSAEAKLVATKGNAVSGSVSFVKQGDRIQVNAAVTGLTPGAHGFHIHEKGDCSAPDGTSAGGHFNPAGHPHGHPQMGPHHAGDMSMLEADASGNARLNVELSGVALEGEQGIVGRGVIVHASPDDFKTQPTGNSGARVACGVIVRK